MSLQFNLIGYPSGVPVQDAGAYYTPITKTNTFFAVQNDTVVWTPAAGKRIHLLGAEFSTSADMDIQLESNNVDVIPPLYFIANGGANITGPGEIWRGGWDDTLAVTSSASGNWSIKLWGYEN